MAKVFAGPELPHFESLRDSRRRLDLVTDNVPVGARAMKVDRVVYQPGDSAAAHYHTGCLHLFYVLRGRGVAYLDDVGHELEEGSLLVVEPDVVHWFENPSDAEFSFVEFWAPPPEQTVWVNEGDI